MLRSIILISLLISSVCALQWEMQKEDFTANDLGKGSGEIQSEQPPAMCKVCKWAMKKLKNQISNGATQDDVKKMLAMVCDEIVFQKSLCWIFVNEYKETLVEELSTTDNATTICINIGVCKK